VSQLRPNRLFRLHRLDRYLFGELLPPFTLSLVVLTLIFVVNFLIRSMDRILGKGLPLWVVIKLIVLNLAWMLALALPMSVLVAVLLAYGRLAADHEVTALRASGVALPRIMAPALIFALLVGAFTAYFNDRILPDVNHQARLLSSDIYRKRPDLDIVPGYFIEDLPEYNLRVDKVTPAGFEGVMIFSKGDRQQQVSIFARRGRLTTKGDWVILHLYDGEKHVLQVGKLGDYQREFFDSTRLAIKVSNLQLKHYRSSIRGDREMSISMMQAKIKRYRERIEKVQRRMEDIFLKSPLFKGDTLHSFAALLDTVHLFTPGQPKPEGLNWRAWNRAVNQLRVQQKVLHSYRRQINKYGVEIHKKLAMPVACLVFALMGVPLGVMTRKSSAAIIAAMAMFFFYWAFMIAGEELADRLVISPVTAMWTPDVLFGLLGIWVTYETTRERHVFRWELIREFGYRLIPRYLRRRQPE